MIYYLIDSAQDLFGPRVLSALQVFFQVEFRAFLAVLLSFFMVCFFGRRTIRWLLKQKVGDAPEFYNADLNKLMEAKTDTPTMGGILICGSILVTVLLLANLSGRHIQLGIAVLFCFAVLGGFDDWLKLTSQRRSPGSREGLFAWEKLLFQAGIGLMVGAVVYTQAAGDEAAKVLNLPFQRTFEPLEVSQLVTRLPELNPSVIVLGMIPFVIIAMLFIAGTSNAVNISDGMDGLAAGVMGIAAIAFMILVNIASDPGMAGHLLVPYVEGSQELMVLTGAMAGACLGFLWFNSSPAMVFMGDTGSLPLGGLLGYVAVAIRQEFLLLVIGGIFFMEMGSVILQVGYFKMTGGKRIFRCSPIHHHFHLGGWSEQQVVTRFWLITIVLSMAAFALLKLR
ncbi:MAG: phospho-N-acetylmuramoyl-pentapeptide-transferase [Phycisphaerales bacterium]|nr:phospho-N-acetylmuramoyl-pentapeptide-transferase [Phycisphaerales bacterium]